ncbi:hypothetical protein [Brevundimonas sp.]|uniref:hypothetical protein n=1 Tax=Brevundimonas sp. TaxID=1871086 RepID=UPI002488B593|nr:hypothetical protein [Brevundimonas sp.]MDI1279977.1 hypothetical protein [Brevundimonas sp.]
MSDRLEIDDVIKVVCEITQLVERHGGEAIAARVAKTCRRLSEGDLDALGSLLAETTGGMGSLNDFGFGPEAEPGMRCLKVALTESTAEKCRVAMRRHGLEVWR